MISLHIRLRIDCRAEAGAHTHTFDLNHDAPAELPLLSDGHGVQFNKQNFVYIFERPRGGVVKSATRVIDIVEFVAGQRDGVSHKDIASALAIPKSSLTGLLSDLQERGYVALDRRTRLFTLGPRVLHLSSAFAHQFDLVRAGAGHVNTVVSAVNESGLLAIPEGNEILVVYHRSAAQSLGSTMEVGERAPMYATAVGRALLAHMDAQERDQILMGDLPRPITSKTIVDLDRIRDELDAISDGGPAYSRDEYIDGLTSVAYAVLNADDRPIAGISVAIPSIRYDDAMDRRCRDALKDAAERFSREMGWSGSF